MKTSPILLAASLILATSAFAIPNPNRSSIEAEQFAPAQPLITVAPEIEDRHAGRVLKVRLTVDSEGRPSDVRVTNSIEQDLVKQVVKAVSQWEFAPATRDGVAIETRVVLPLEVRLGQSS